MNLTHQQDIAPLTYCVTGASSGVGLSVVRLLAARGQPVIGVGRRSTAELPAAFPNITYHQFDLADPIAPLVELAAPANRLIHAAGTGFHRPLESEDETTIARALTVNFTSVVRLLHGLHPHLERNAGRVALLGSLAAGGSPDMAIYSAARGAGGPGPFAGVRMGRSDRNSPLPSVAHTHAHARTRRLRRPQDRLAADGP